MAHGRGRYSQAYRRAKANLRLRRDPCGICGQPIDYTLPREHPDSFTADHIVPLSIAPHLADDPGNLRAAHARCNKSRGNRLAPPSLGQPSRIW